ncbi:unnamed protein product, partial [Hapterophycus canaliculatus]
MFPRVMRLRPAYFGSNGQHNGVGCRAGSLASQQCSAAMFSVCSSPRRYQGANSQAEDVSVSSNSSSPTPDGLKAFQDIVISRKAASGFGDKEVDLAVLRDIMALTQSAPSSFNIQPWSVVLVRDPIARERLSTAMLGGNAKKVLAAPVTAVFCADLEPSKRIYRMEELNRRAGMGDADIKRLSLAVNLFSGEGLLGNVVRKTVTGIASPMRPAPEV